LPVSKILHEESLNFRPGFRKFMTCTLIKMNSFSIKDLAKIIERDSKDATYKFALLRGTIDIIQENDNYREVTGQVVTFPMGLLILKWIEYYYPILSHDSFIPQKHGDSRKRTIAFRPEFEKVIGLYPSTKYADQLFFDLKKGILDPVKIEPVLSLVEKTKYTIINQPMHYIGSTIGQGGGIYTYNKDSSRNPRIGHLTLEWIINHSGTFTIPIDLYHVMQTVGRFVTGSHSIIFRWAEFTSHLSKETAISTSDMISLLKSDFNERDILYREFTGQFRTEMQVSWLGRKPFSDRSWKNDSYENLKHLCNHLIEDRGFEPYKNI